jgi:hypothetical protein
VSFYFGVSLAGGRRSERGDTFCFAGFAAFWFVSELFIVEEQLLPGGEDKVGAAVNALQHSVLEFHRELLWPGASAIANGKGSRQCVICRPPTY